MTTYLEASPLKPTHHDPDQDRALRLLHGKRHLIIAGGGGTGKTHLIKTYLRETEEPVAIAAPTGVAAALYGDEGAVTIYNLFGFPATVSPDFIARAWRISGKKRRVLATIKTLILDEFSMIRSDLLDMVDLGLRTIRRSSKPFGGVRLVLVGDPAQLPPIVHDREIRMFSSNFGGYTSQYVVSSTAFLNIIEDTDVCVLNRQHRQTDPEFARVVANIRSGTHEEVVEAINLINTRVIPDFDPEPGSEYVTFTTRRDIAESINAAQTALLEDVQYFDARVTGDRDKIIKHVQAPETLAVAKGSQVMMLTNDREGRWVNGTVGVVESLEYDSFENATGLKIKMGDRTHYVHRHTWEVTSPKVEEVGKKKKIGHEVIGSFKQFPVQPSWATTIHKSQGRTCEKVILDMNTGAFVEGQTYVGVSRCTSLKGLVLRTPLTLNDVKVPEVARWFDQWAINQCPVICHGAVTRDSNGDIAAVAIVVAQGPKIVAEMSTIVGQGSKVTEDNVAAVVERIAQGAHYIGDEIPGLDVTPLSTAIDVDKYFETDEGTDTLAQARALASAARAYDIYEDIVQAGKNSIINAAYGTECPTITPETAFMLNPDMIFGKDAFDWFNSVKAITAWICPGDQWYQQKAAAAGLDYPASTLNYM